jgi:hypothetical protein
LVGASIAVAHVVEEFGGGEESPGRSSLRLAVGDQHLSSGGIKALPCGTIGGPREWRPCAVRKEVGLNAGQIFTKAVNFGGTRKQVALRI